MSKYGVIAICLVAANSSCVLAQSYKSNNYGGVETTVVSKYQDRTVYRVQSNDYPGNSFSRSDLDNYSYRVNRRNCTDPDIMFMMRKGHVFQYDFFGSDNIKVGTFYCSASVCLDQYKIR